MTAAGRRRASRARPTAEVAALRGRVAEAEETLRAIRAGEVDAVIVAGKRGAQVFTLEGAEHAYRVLVESMSEGALTLSADKTILYANRCFAGMVKLPLQQLIGSSFRRFLSAGDRASLRLRMKRTEKAGSKIQVLLTAGDGSHVPAQLSLRRLAKNGGNRATIGMVVTDLTEPRRSEEALRELSRRLVRAQETERGRVAVELHDRITQPLCAVVLRSQTLANTFSASDGPSKQEAMALSAMLVRSIDELERISRGLRPSVLERLGLAPVLRAAGKEFADRTGVAVTLTLARWRARLPRDSELALFRIFQEALTNVEKHAGARCVSVTLGRRAGLVRLTIEDDGVGFDAVHGKARGRRTGGLGLLGMRERMASVGGTVEVTSSRGKGTHVEVRAPHGGR